MVEKTVSKKTVSCEKPNFPELGKVEKSERHELMENSNPNIKSSEKKRMGFGFFVKIEKNLLVSAEFLNPLQNMPLI